MSDTNNISIKIERNKGITHALLSYAQEHKFKHKGAKYSSKSDWAQTLEVLSQIQHSRDNNVSIFHKAKTESYAEYLERN